MGKESRLLPLKFKNQIYHKERFCWRFYRDVDIFYGKISKNGTLKKAGSFDGPKLIFRIWFGLREEKRRLLVRRHNIKWRKHSGAYKKWLRLRKRLIVWMKSKFKIELNFKT